jgi:hypothetical protein
MSELGFIRKRIPFVRPILPALKNLLKGKIATVLNFSINLENLENATDENFDTATTWGTGKANDKSIIDYTFDLTPIRKIIYKVGVKTDNPEYEAQLGVHILDRNGEWQHLTFKTITTTEEAIIQEELAVNMEISKVVITVNDNMTPAITYIRVYEVQSLG